jgi:hypothetical protein
LAKTYNWRRFWLPADSTFYLDDGAYLFDPTDKFLASLNPGIADLFELRGKPCKILFGESGMGKSSALRADFARIKESWAGTDDRGALIDVGAVTSISDLRSSIENDAEVLTWRSAGRGVMNLYLDSLDEANPAYPAISKGLMAVMNALA